MGIDPSAKKIALVAHEPLTNSFVVESKALYPKGTTSQTPESLAIAQEWCESVILVLDKLAGPNERILFIEKPLVGRGGIEASLKQAFVGGVIRACFARAGFEVIQVHPSTWRAGLGIKAKETKAVKAETRTYVRMNMPKVMQRLGDDADLTDAAGIVLYGESFLRLGRPAKPPRRRVSRRTNKTV